MNSFIVRFTEATLGALTGNGRHIQTRGAALRPSIFNISFIGIVLAIVISGLLRIMLISKPPRRATHKACRLILASPRCHNAQDLFAANYCGEKRGISCLRSSPESL